jgi:hypothetical protein
MTPDQFEVIKDFHSNALSVIDVCLVKSDEAYEGECDLETAIQDMLAARCIFARAITRFNKART